MQLREYITSDCEQLSKLFFQTVHSVNAKDYTKEQLDVWATGTVDLKEWDKSFTEHYTVVAIDNNIIVGFGDIDKTGYLDRLYVHADYQGKGVATAICNRLEQAVQGKITTHASITAKPFFEKRGYKVVKEQQVERQGIYLINFCMEKTDDFLFRMEKVMIVLITGASHTGKTMLAQKLLEKYKYPYLSIDHLKMGLIRSGYTKLTPQDDDMVTKYLWPIVREIIKTAIENKQNLIVEGCYIPFDWANDFAKEYLDNIKYYCLVMSENYIKKHFNNIKKYASVIESRLDDEWCTMESVLEDNAQVLELSQKNGINYFLIDNEYNVDIEL